MAALTVHSEDATSARLLRIEPQLRIGHFFRIFSAAKAKRQQRRNPKRK
jgi:hypothetical protein